MEVCAEQLGALDVVALVDLLVLRVRAVVARAHRQQDHVLPSGLLQSQRHRDRATWRTEQGGNPRDGPSAIMVVGYASVNEYLLW